MMQASQAPSSLSFKGRLGYFFAIAGFFGALSAYFYAGSSPLRITLQVLFPLLVLSGVVLIIGDPYTKLADWRFRIAMLFTNIGVAKSGLGKVGYSLMIFGILLTSMRFELLEPDRLNELTSPYGVIAMMTLVVGTFLFLRD